MNRDQLIQYGQNVNWDAKKVEEENIPNEKVIQYR